MARARTIVAAVAVLAGGVAFASSYDLSRDDVKVTVETQPDAVDPGRDFFVTLTLSAPAEQLPQKDFKRRAASVMAATASVSAKLGWKGKV